MKYTILFLHYDPDQKLVEQTKNALYSIITNSIGHEYEIIVLDRKGLRKEINRGFRESRGEYVILFSNDVVVENNWLDYFAVPNTITSSRKTVSSFDPAIKLEEVDCSCVCFPKSVIERIGDWDENFDGGYGYCDTDYLLRAKKLGISLEEVPIKIIHKERQTFNIYPELNEKNNKEYLYKKHNL